MEAWNRWHPFPDAAPDHPDAANPQTGDAVDVECKDKHATFPDAPLQVFTIERWVLTPPYYGVPSQFKILRWRHRDPDTARRWQERWDKGEAEARSRIE